MEDMDSYPDEPRRGAEYVMGMQRIAADTQNLLSAAHAQGIGDCWFRPPLFHQGEVDGVLGIPLKVEPMVLVGIGYPLETPEPPIKMPPDEVVYLDFWGNRR